VFHFTHRSRFCSPPAGSRTAAFVALCGGIALTGLTTTPYDFIAYALLLVSAWFSFKFAEDPRLRWCGAVVGLTLVGTLNRETAWLHVAFFATVVAARLGVRRSAPHVVLVAIAGFGLPYIGLRVLLGAVDATHNRVELAHNFATPVGVAGTTVWVLGTWACLRRARGPCRRLMLAWFHALALPYTGMCIYAGRLEELRLFVPVLLAQLLLTSAVYSCGSAKYGNASRKSTSFAVGLSPTSVVAS
jgi:hypothetical protein